jgi:hypothetical protein
MEIVAALRQEKKTKKQLNGIRRTILVLSGSERNTAGMRRGINKPRRGRGVVSASLRAHLSRKTKEGWAKIKAESK